MSACAKRGCRNDSRGDRTHCEEHDTHDDSCHAYAHKAFLPELCNCGFKPPVEITEKPLRWMSQASFGAVKFSKGLRLGLVVTPTGEEWTAVAIETDGSDTASIFDSHAHHIIGEFPKITDAFEACETYAKEWKRGKRTADDCECEEITK